MSLQRVSWAPLFLASIAAAAGPDAGTAEPKFPRLIDSLYENLEWGWGISNDDQLRRALEEIDPHDPDRSNAWLLHKLDDWPNAAPIWEAIYDRDPNDSEAVGLWSGEIYFSKGPAAYVDFLAKTDLRHLAFRNERGQQFWEANLEGNAASNLVRLGRVDEALAISKRAIESGGGWLAYNGRAEALLSAGRFEEAVEAAEIALRITPGSARATLWKGLALDALGRKEEAKALFARAHQQKPDDEAPRRALAGEQHSIPEWVAYYTLKHDREHGEQLAHCGHYYLDLGWKERAERCFALSERIEREPPTAMRLAHMAETDPASALQQVEKLLETDRHFHYLCFRAWLLLGYGRKDEAKALIDEAMTQEAWAQKTNSVRTLVCGAFEDGLCVIDARWRQGINVTHLPLPWAWHWIVRALKGEPGALAQARAVVTHQTAITWVLPGTALALSVIAGVIVVRIRRRRRARKVVAPN